MTNDQARAINLAETLREAVKAGMLRLEAANMGEGDDSIFPIHNVEINKDGTVTVSSNDFLCHPRD